MREDSVALVSVAVALALFGCSKEDSPGPDFRPVALEFAQALAARDYAKAHALTSSAYKKQTTVEGLKAAFERIVPLDWGPVGPIAVGETMTAWPDKQQGDLGWAYVSIGGDVMSEAVIVVVTSENGTAKIRQVEFGRP